MKLTSKEIALEIKSIFGFSIQTLFDPVQTHAVYNVPAERVDEVKQFLKTAGAIQFRLVKNKNRNVAICFKLKK